MACSCSCNVISSCCSCYQLQSGLEDSVISQCSQQMIQEIENSVIRNAEQEQRREMVSVSPLRQTAIALPE